MIPLSKLEAVDAIVCHKGPDSPCPDGVASALILRDVLPDASVRFVSHGDLPALEPRAGMLMCDIAPPADYASEFLDAGVIVLDHHRSARSVVERFVVAELGAFADEERAPGVSGALLAFRNVWEPLAHREQDNIDNHPAFDNFRQFVLDFAQLAGVRDTWQKSDPRWCEACAQAEALRFWPFERWSIDVFEPLYRNDTLKMLSIGDVLIERGEERDRRLIESAYRLTTLKGTRVVIIPSRETSDVAERLGAEADLVVGFSYSARGFVGELLVSTRSRGDFDCASFCASYGGGGHARAAGFTIPLAGSEKQPYAAIRDMINFWEGSR